MRHVDLPQRLGESHRSLAELVADELRRRILTGQLEAGARVVEETMARELGVSRNPVREALKALTAEGYVHTVPRRGSTVAVMSGQEAGELFDLRAALEGVSARIAARKQDTARFALLDDLLAQAREATEAGDLDLVARLNVSFHAGIAAASGNAYLQMIAGPMLERSQWVFLSTANARLTHSLHEHVEILAALRSGDEDEAERQARAHVEAARRSFNQAA
ncbi:GntR family transcriptional regulator [Actinopolymorpha alba]|uniref:GntR family transcriptional regulator n=1 Tax=Actinopolymorpha alba TaxID=533267 RepID=UPI00036C900D|nr:GntR family transcriptional regulator [Actinopolymorpha alba]